MTRLFERIRASFEAHTKTAVIGAASVAVLAAGAVLAISGGTASGSPDPGQRTARPSFAAEPRSDGSLLSITQLPHRPELAAWTATQGDGPVLVCVPEDVMAGLTPEATQTTHFGAYGVDSDRTGPFAARVGEQVLELTDENAASDAMQSLAGWLQDCAARDLVRPLSIESRTVKGPAQGFWETYLRSARAVCTDCDAVYFDRQALVRVGNQLVLLSLTEIGGPLQPEHLTKTMSHLVHAAVAAAS
jgi:hypothetical protein